MKKQVHKNIVHKNKRELIRSVVQATDDVLDVGFWGQGVDVDNPDWVHNVIKRSVNETYGVDLNFDQDRLEPTARYFKASAESFDIPKQFDVIFAGDLIEHLSNPGLFIKAATRHLKLGGRLVLTTPNCFNLFHLTEKLTKREPTVNPDHTCYFNEKTLAQLLAKNGITDVSFASVYSLDVRHKRSWKKKGLDVIYRLLSNFTDKYMETLVVIARP